MPFDDITAAEFAALRHLAGADRSPGRLGGLQLLMAHSARAALPGLRAAVEAYRPDLIVRNTAELAALVVARTHGIAEMPVPTPAARSSCSRASRPDGQAGTTAVAAVRRAVTRCRSSTGPNPATAQTASTTSGIAAWDPS